jgi:hypothetical protein
MLCVMMNRVVSHMHCVAFFLAHEILPRLVITRSTQTAMADCIIISDAEAQPCVKTAKTASRLGSCASAVMERPVLMRSSLASWTINSSAADAPA